jgi:hypothetical protein
MPRFLTALTVLAALAASAAARPQTDGTIDPIEATLPAKGSKPAVETPPRLAPADRSLPGDSCFGPHPILCGDVTSARTDSATSGGSDPIFACRAIAPGHGAGSVWFSYTATTTSAIITTQYTAGPRLPNNLAPDTVIQVFGPSPNCADLGAPIACDDDNGPGFLSRLNLTNLQVGATYLIEVAAWDNNYVSDDYTITIAGNCSSVPNDGCANAAVLACNSETVIDLSPATSSPNDPNVCVTNPQNTRWFSITPSTARVRLVASSDADTAAVLKLFSGACGSLNSIACAFPPSTGTTTTLETPVVPGQTYLLLVGHHPEAQTSPGQLTLTAECVPVAVNDECFNAIALQCGQTVVAPLTMGTGNVNDPFNDCQNTVHSNSVWYSFVATTPRVRVTTAAAPSEERGIPPTAVVSILSGNCDAPNLIDCGDTSDPNLFSSAEAAGLTIGETYYVIVGARSSLPSNGRGAVFDVSVTLECFGTPPENDTCATAQTIECGADFIAPVSTATSEDGGIQIDCADGRLFAAVWYRFTAPDSGAVRIRTFDPETGLDPDGQGDSIVVLYSGACGKRFELACDDDEEITEDTLYSDLTVTTLEPGATYLLAIGTYDQSEFSSADFRVTLDCAPSNDSCEFPIAVECGETFLADTRAATVVPGEVNDCVTDDAGSLWYSFVATSRSVTITATLPAGNPLADSVLTLYTDSPCDKLIELACNDDTDLSDFSRSSYLTYDDLSVGVTYLLRVSAYDSESTDVFAVNVQCSYQGDECAKPIRFLDCNVTINVDTGLATTSMSDPIIECVGDISTPPIRGEKPSPGFGTIWFSFIASSNQAVISTSSVDRGGEVDPILVAYSGSCGKLVPIACADDTEFSRFPTLILSDLTPGEEYFLELAATSASAVGPVQVNFNCPAITDECFSSGQLPCGASALVDTNTLTTNNLLDPNLTLCLSEGQTVNVTGWARIFPPQDSEIISIRARAFDPGVQPVLAAIAYNCGSDGTTAQILECSSVVNKDGVVEIRLSGLQAFESYFLVVGNTSQTQGRILVSSDCYCPIVTCPASATLENEPCEGGLNDTCETAQPINPAQIICGTSRPRALVPFFADRGDSEALNSLDIDTYSFTVETGLNARVVYVATARGVAFIGCGCNNIGSALFSNACEFGGGGTAELFFPAGQYNISTAIVAQSFTDCTYANYLLAVIPFAACPGDANADGIVSFLDITTVLANFGNVYNSKENPLIGFGDADSSGDVAFLDITTVLANFGTVCTLNNVVECNVPVSRDIPTFEDLINVKPVKRSSGDATPAASSDSPAAIRRAAKQR